MFRVFNFILILIVLIIIGVVILNFLQIFSSGPPGQDVLIHIESGSNTIDIAELLADKGIIKSAVIFRALAGYTKSGENLKAGDYTLNTGMSMMEILEELKKGKIRSDFFTVPEGYTLKQIGKLLEQNEICEAKEFLELTSDGVPPGIDFEYAHLVEGKSLEGFLFPDTYGFSGDTNAMEVIKMMLDRFEEVVPDNMEAMAKLNGLEPYEVIVLASLIEREAKIKEERPLVAAVYYNRIKKDMLLQCDATIQYLFDEPKELLTYDDLEIESPYNTYLYKGLPPGPIANPGLASITASLNPAEADYLYYVLEKDGKHKFSSNYDDHLNAVEEYKKNSEK